MAMTVGELVAIIDADDRGFARGVDQAERGLQRLESSAGRHLDRVSDRFGDAFDPAEAIAGIDQLIAALDGAAGPAGQAGERAGREAGDGFVRGADGRLRDARGRFVSTDLFGPLVDGATDAGKKTGQALGDGVGVLGKLGPANVAIMAGAMQALPTVASAVAGGIGAALGGALLAVGFTGAASADRVQKAWSDTVSEIRSELADAAQPLEGSAIRAADVARRAFERLKPSLARIWRDLVPDVDNFVAKVGQGVGSLGPTLERLGDSFGDVLSELGDRMPAIVDNIADTLDTFSAMMDEDPQMLANLVEDATQLLSVGAEVLAWADDISAAFQFIAGANPRPLVDKIMGGSPQEQLAQLQQVPGAMADLQTAIDGSIAAIEEVGSAGQEGADGVRALNDALEEFFAPAQNALAAQNDWKEALQEATAALDKGNLSTLDRSRHLENLLGTLAQNAAAEKEATGATERSSAAFEKNIGALVRMAGSSATGRTALDGLAESLGYTVERAGKATIVTDELGNRIKILPSGKTVKLDADSKDADGKLDTTKRKLAGVKDKKFKVDGDTKQAQSAVDKVVDKLNGVGPQANQAGKDMGSGLIAGIRSMIGSAVEAAKDLAASALKGAKDFLGIQSPSTAMAEVGRWTVRGLIKGLTEEEGQVKSTVERMVKQVKDAFASQPDVAEGLLVFIRQGNKNLEDLALQREALVQRLADAKEMAKKVAGTAQEWADITGLDADTFTGAGDMAEELRTRASAINNFANNINTLAKRGLNKKVIQDIIDAGVEKGATFAEMLVGSDGSEIKALNKAQAAVDKASKKLGKASADAMYDTGKKAGDGYLKGLQDSLKKLDKEMSKIVKALIRAIKKELKIKSPSQVMAEIGQFAMEGFIVGLEAMGGAVQAAMGSMVGRAITAAHTAVGPPGAGMVPGSMPGAPAAAMVNGQAAVAGIGINGQSVPGTGGGSVVNVHMPDAVIREDADLTRLGNEFSFQLAAYG